MLAFHALQAEHHALEVERNTLKAYIAQGIALISNPSTSG
jgi:hypothetical protein